jgi:selenocysteine-specific translation elongation factor
MPEIEIGKVTHYFGHIQVAAIELSGPVSVGDRIRIVGHTTDRQENVESIQVEHQSITEAKAGDSIGIRVAERVRPHDKVFKIVQEGGAASL